MKPVCIFMITSLLIYRPNVSHFEEWDYTNISDCSHTHKVLLIPADKHPALMSGYHPISQWPWAEWNMIGCQPESEI